MLKITRYFLPVLVLVLVNFPSLVHGIQDVPDTLVFVKRLGDESEPLYWRTWSFDGKYLAAQSRNRLYVWNSETWENVLTISCEITYGLVWSPKEYILLVSCLNTERTLEVNVIMEGLTLRISNNRPLAWLLDGSLIVVQQEDATLGIIDAETGNILSRYGVPCTNPSMVTEIGGCPSYDQVTWSPNGRYLSWPAGDMEGPNIEMLEFGIRPNTQLFKGAENILWLPDGNRFILDTRTNLQVWESATFQMINSIESSAYWLEDVPSSDSVVLCELDNQVMILDTNTLEVQPLQIVAEPENTLFCYYLQWSSNNLLATSNLDGTISIWRAQ